MRSETFRDETRQWSWDFVECKGGEVRLGGCLLLVRLVERLVTGDLHVHEK